MNVRDALLAANGLTLKQGKKRWRIETREIRGHFSCVAIDLTPENEEEERFCVMDLWRSESDRAGRMLAKAVEIGSKTTVPEPVDWEDTAKQYQAV